MYPGHLLGHPSQGQPGPLLARGQLLQGTNLVGYLATHSRDLEGPEGTIPLGPHSIKLTGQNEGQ